MTNGNIRDTVIDRFLSKLDADCKLPSKVVGELKTLAQKQMLSGQEAIEAALKSDLFPDHDETKDS